MSYPSTEALTEHAVTASKVPAVVVPNFTSVELRHLAALIAVGQEGSFSRAAETLGYTQSAVSQQIASLERRLGERLVHRPGGPRRVSLTAAGEVLARHAELIMQQVQSASAELRMLREDNRLRVGCFQSVRSSIVPGILRALTDAQSEVRVDIVEHEHDDELLAALVAGALDLAFYVAPLPHGPYEFEELMQDSYVAVLPRDSEQFAGRATIDAVELVGHPIVTYALIRKEHQVENRLGVPGIDRSIVSRSNDNSTVFGMAAAGIGIAVVPRLSCKSLDPNLRIIPVRDVTRRTIGVCWHRERRLTAASLEFLESARTVAAGFSEPFSTCPPFPRKIAGVRKTTLRSTVSHSTA